MGFLDRTRTLDPLRAPRPSAAPISGRTGAQLLEAADTAYALAEAEFDRSPETREELEYAYLGAARALDAEDHPQRASAWLGLPRSVATRRAAAMTRSRRSMRR